MSEVEHIQVYGGAGRNECEPITFRCQSADLHVDLGNSHSYELWFIDADENRFARLEKLMQDQYYIPMLTISAKPQNYLQTFPGVRIRSLIRRPHSEKNLFMRFTWGEP